MEINIDNHKLMHHKERVGEWKTGGDCFPIYIEIGPTNICNHNCLFCALDYLEHGGVNINSEVMCRNLEDIANHGVKSVMFAGEGEPLLHKSISKFVKVAKNSGMDVSITTNGIPLNKEKTEEILPFLSWIRFSLDAGTAETYSQVHGTRKEDFEKALNNLKYAVEIKRKNNYEATIGVQALLTNKSINELILLGKRLKEIGADNLQIKPYSHHPLSKNDLSFDYKEAEKIRPDLESLSDERFKVIYRKDTIQRLQNERGYEICHGLPFFSLIDCRGNVIPCNMFYGIEEFNYGNINKNLFSEIWKGEKRKKVIERLNQKGVGECRAGCRLDAINKYLEGVKKERIKLEETSEPKPAHVNFI